MVRGSVSLLKSSAAAGISATLADILVCPLSKQPLRLCQKTNSLISDSIGVSFPIVDGIPRLVPNDGKIIDADDNSSSEDAKGSPEMNSSAEKLLENTYPIPPTRPQMFSQELQLRLCQALLFAMLSSLSLLLFMYLFYTKRGRVCYMVSSPRQAL